MSRRDHSVLLVSSEPSETGFLRSFLASRGLAVHVTTAPGAVQSLAFRSYGLVIVDVGHPGIDGVALTRRALEFDHDVPVLLIAHKGVSDELIEGLRLGATDYVSYPVVPEELERKVTRYRDSEAILPWMFDDSALVAESASMKAVVSRAARASGVDLPVFLQGELGSGKKTIARVMHRFGASRAEPFVALNLESIPGHLMTDELFGARERTGGESEHRGVLGAAGRGAVVLENIDAMPLAVQLELMAVLDTGMIHPLGPSLDARLYCTAASGLETLVTLGRLQSGLHHRLQALRIALPALRERVDDIPALAVHFLRAFSDDDAKAVLGITPEALAAICHYGWPGNVREFANVMERAYVLATDVVELRHLPPQVSSVTVRARLEGPTQEPEH